jgi:hypothetical protein
MQRTVAQTLLWLRSGASKHMLRARDALRAGLSRAQEWVHSRGPERLRLRLCAGVRSTGDARQLMPRLLSVRVYV